jgi:hypothetical protein
MIQQTSLLAYQQIKDRPLNPIYNLILNMLESNPEGLTDQELTRLCGFQDPNKVRPRRNELVKEGFVMEWGAKTCPVTDKKSINWILRHDFNGK